MGDKPDAGEAFNLMVAYYQAHPVRAMFHFFLALLTGGFWIFWFVGFWFGTVIGVKDVEGMRALND
jgi:hypothetical protein